MKLELKNINIQVKLSEETPAYTGRLFVDGKFFAEVSNHGQGGCDMQYPPKGTEKGFYDRVNALDKQIAETFPTHDSEWSDEPLKESLEMWCHGKVWEHVDQRNFKSSLSRKVLAYKDGKVYTYKGKKSEALMDAVAKQSPDLTILNRVTFDEAWVLYNKAA